MRSYIAFIILALLMMYLIFFTFQKGFFKNILEFKKINNIELINNKFISKDFFFEHISVKEGQSFWTFNPFKLEKELKSIKEIKNFNFFLNLDGNLKISIEEEKPFMKWIEENKESFIDYNGNILILDKVDKNLKLIKLYGVNANKYLPSIKKVLLERSEILENINTILFQKNIGWSLLLKDSNCILLPLKKLDKVMDMFQNIKESEIYSKFNFFDLRIFGRVYMSNRKC